MPQDDPPPIYTAQTSPPAASGASSQAPPSLVKPSNFVSICRNNGSVKGTWVIDPSLAIPTSLRPPLSSEETEETRKNLSLESKNGPIDANISFAPYDPSHDPKQNARRRTTLYTRTSNGSVTAKLVSLVFPFLDFVKFNLVISSMHLIPRDFRFTSAVTPRMVQSTFRSLVLSADSSSSKHITALRNSPPRHQQN